MGTFFLAVMCFILGPRNKPSCNFQDKLEVAGARYPFLWLRKREFLNKETVTLETPELTKLECHVRFQLSKPFENCIKMDLINNNIKPMQPC